MLHSNGDPRRTRLLDDERTVARMKSELGALTMKREQDLTVLAALLESLRLDEAEIDDVRGRIQNLVDSIERRRAAFTPRCLSTYPLELLGYIFEWACYSKRLAEDDHDEPMSHQLKVDKVHSLQPLRCAAVCRRWRAAAMHTATLWTYVGVTDCRGQQASALQYYVQQLLQRSGVCLLDIVMELPRDWHMRASYDSIIRALVASSRRWRSLSMYSSASINAMREDPIDILRVVTPNLERVFLQFNDSVGQALMEWPEDSTAPRSLPRCLPHAPKLRTIIHHNAPLTLSPDNPSLGSVEVYAAQLDEFRWDYFVDAAHAMSALRVLHISWSFSNEDILQIDPGQLKIPTLEELHLSVGYLIGEFDSQFAIPLNRLEAPGIRSIHLTGEMLVELQPLVTQCAPCLTHIYLFSSRVDPRIIPALSRAANLETLDISNECTLCDSFFKSLVATSSSRQWPRLRHVDVSDAITRPENAFAILDFLRARYAAVNDTAPGVPPCEVIEFEGASSTFRPWVNNQMQHILEAAPGSGLH
ncbi:hypothetical protein EXIGLDRAFT_724865 [Exidia glandulosa HHB12029]|uniref:Uncharacterized protein n=1 Tax=Exidia glandulosa HHB12029 TaxID=1314781 RepID=A0A165E8J5_EXIGL|nr:hypothetical protein EXIGLDRAFT_724865 [Exidia glandulosa HHB12029]